jgi:FtsP/CotA-like multicopper oxidase with cupredoxin domain
MHALSRRSFLQRATRGGGGLLLGTALPGLSGLTGCDLGTESGPFPPDDPAERFPLRIPTAVTPQALTLAAAPGQSDVGGGVLAPVWALNGQVPSPLLRVRRGDPFQVEMVNQLPQDLILHWHGLTPPADMDGHPRFAVGPGGRYRYNFTVGDRAGTYWYHSHTHHRTAEQTFRGIAGMLIVEDDAERIELPSGEREIPLLLQDRRVDGGGVPFYDAAGPAMMAGYMGPVPFVNGVRRPFVEVDSARIRLRILNGSNARIFRLTMDNGSPFHLLGNDGGFLERPYALEAIDVAPAERVDLLIDLRALSVGQRAMLRSNAFTIPGGMGFMGGANLQGNPLDLLEFRVTRSVADSAPLPATLPPLPPSPQPGDARRERTFRFTSQMMEHRINGRIFEMDRIDERIPFDETEIWSFVNDSGMPHPVHLHATHFRVLSRSGGRNQVFPWETGRKDTVLILPSETVRVAVRFTAQRGLFLLHCHNLEHEDMGMMANLLVE